MNYILCLSLLLAICTINVFSQAHPELLAVEKNKGFHYTFNGSWDLTGGNNSMSNLSINPTVSWHKGKEEIVFEGFYIWGSWDNEEWLDQRSYSIRNIYEITERIDLDLYAIYQKDNIILLDSRILSGTGIRYQLFTSNVLEQSSVDVFTGTGLAYEKESFKPVLTPNVETQLIRWASYFTLLWNYNERYQVSLSSHFQSNTASFSDFRNIVQLDASHIFTSVLSVVYSFRLRYDNEPIVGIKSTDYFGTVGFQLAF